MNHFAFDKKPTLGVGLRKVAATKQAAAFFSDSDEEDDEPPAKAKPQPTYTAP